MSLRNKWIATFAWIIFIYGSLPIVRPISSFLRTNNLLNVTIGILFLTIAFMCGWWLRKYFKNINVRIWIYIAIIIGAYSLVLFLIRIPEERFHLIQYGVLVFLAFHALREKFPSLSAYFLSFIFASLIGWGDEGIQYLLPDRYYELKDVWLNCLSAFLGLGVIFVVNQIRKAKNVPY